MGAKYDLNWGSSEDRDVLEIMAAFETRRRKLALRQMPAIAATGRNRTFIQGNGVGGYLNSRVHAASFHYWGQRLGYQCWNDPQFVREYLRDNEYARVESRPQNMTIRMPDKGGINFRSANFNGGFRLN